MFCWSCRESGGGAAQEADDAVGARCTVCALPRRVLHVEPLCTIVKRQWVGRGTPGTSLRQRDGEAREIRGARSQCPGEALLYSGETRAGTRAHRQVVRQNDGEVLARILLRL